MSRIGKAPVAFGKDVQVSLTETCSPSKVLKGSSRWIVNAQIAVRLVKVRSCSLARAIIGSSFAARYGS